MFRGTRLQMAAVLAVALGGYLAASGRLPLMPRSEAAPDKAHARIVLRRRRLVATEPTAA